MNKEELISLETAKLAKEKGFDWVCKGAFRKNNKTAEIFDGGCCYNILSYFYTLCPTQSLLQKWLRDEYDIHIHTVRENYFQTSEYKYYYNVISRGRKSDILGSVDTFSNLMAECSQNVEGNYLNDEKFSKLIFERGYAFDSYEEALEDGLFEALKLIE